MEDLHVFDRYFLNQPEPGKSCLLVLKELILNVSPEITTAWKYGMPFFCVRKKMLCYLWTDKDTGQPYIGFVDGKLMYHPLLVRGKQSRMKILMIDPEDDLPVDLIHALLGQAIELRRKSL